MGTAPYASAPRAAVCLAALAAVLAGCGTGGSNATSNKASPTASASSAISASPSASPSSVPSPVTGSYGVLYGSQAASSYAVSIVGIDGKVVASATTSTPPTPTCANTAAAVVSPPLSMSNSAVYYMEASGGVTRLLVTGGKQQAFSVPAPTASRRAMFAVSPDDQKVAVVVVDFTASGASTRLYVENVDGTAHADLFSESGAFTLWPVGWHGANNLVLGVVPSCTQGGGPFCCSVQELHVVDPATANRRFTIGSRTGCVIAGPPSAAGAVCTNRSDFTTGSVLNWTAGTVRSLAFNGPTFSYLSPDGSMVMFVDNTGTSFTLGAGSMNGFFACTWLDGTHVMSGGDAQHQPRVAEITTQAMVPVAAEGDCAGRLPGGL